METMVEESAAATSVKSENCRIGETAGMVWAYLNTHGEVATSKMIRELGQSRDVLQRAIGWLAREDKVALRRNGAAETIHLK